MTPTSSPSYCSASLLPFKAKTLKWFSAVTVSASSPPTHLSLHSGFHPHTPPKECSLNSLVASLSPTPMDGLVLILPLLKHYFIMFKILFLFVNTVHISPSLSIAHTVLTLLPLLWPLIFLSTLQALPPLTTHSSLAPMYSHSIISPQGFNQSTLY